MAATHVLHSFWRRHRWTALRSLLLAALLHRLHFLALLAAASPVWLLTAFLLGAVLVHSEPNVPLAAASEDEDRHLYKKIRRRPHHQPVTGASASSSGKESSVTSMEEEEEEEEEEDHLVVDKVAWTADDEHSIQSIGSLELERDARLEKLMSRQRQQHPKNPFDLHHSSYYDEHAAAAALDAPGSAPSFLLFQHTNPFDIDIQQPRERDCDFDDEEGTEEAAVAMLRRHGSFTAGAAPLARPSRFKPYFVADVPGGGRDAGSSNNSNSNSNSSSPSSSTAASDHQTQQQVTVRAEEEAPAASTSWDGKGNEMAMAVDVELISDSSDDDMSLHGDDGSLNNAPDDDDDEEDSFEVESITQQVAADAPCECDSARAVSPLSEQRQHDASIVNEPVLASVEANQQRERELILGAVPVIGSSTTGAPIGAAVATPPAAAAPTPSAAAAAAAGPPPAAAPTQPAAAPTPPVAASTPPSGSGKLSSKSKVASKRIDPKKAVFGFFRK